MNIIKYIFPIALFKKVYKKPSSPNVGGLSDAQQDAAEDAASDAD